MNLKSEIRVDPVFASGTLNLDSSTATVLYFSNLYYGGLAKNPF